jgi:hypothetical protein
MDFDYDIDDSQPRARARYNFDQIKPGASMHVKDNSERCRVMAAFKYWAQRDKVKRAGAYATSAKVGDEDPRGPGFRIWFKSSRRTAAETAARVDHGGDI